ncbi:unnamed protein product [Cladocopium goreaui]|uniref:Uncharacterized protein n=1 Tax=Cladocopium goreaui TaxID=2562237 RepID=A0A9P1C4E8_9DINO|nr:unnamed protein product [Cladocopium goreaui]
MGCCCCVSASAAAPPPASTYVGCWVSEGLSLNDIATGYGVHRAKKGYGLIRVANSATGAGAPAPYVKMKIDGSGYVNYGRKEANGFCRVLDLYAGAWDEKQADFGCCGGQLQVTYDASADALLVDGVTLRRCEEDAG